MPSGLSFRFQAEWIRISSSEEAQPWGLVLELANLATLR